MALDLENYRGKYVCGQEILILDWRLRRGDIYEVSVMRQRKELDIVHSAHRFIGEFKNRELEAYNVAPQIFNEFKGEGGAEDKFNLKELRIGIKVNGYSNREQLVMMIGEYRQLDYEAMKANGNIPLRVWERYHPTSLDLAKGASWLYFSPDTITFFLRDHEKRELERKVYQREDSRLRELFGILKRDEAEKVFKTYHLGYDLAKIRDQLEVGDDILNEAAADNDDNEPAPSEN